MDRKQLAAITLFLGSLVWVGCGGGVNVGRTLPVSGKVSYKGKAVSAGSLTFWPSETKGNKSKHEAGAQLDSDGAYELWTKGTKGVPPGWYKVTIVAQAPSDPKDEYSKRVSLIPDMFAKTESSPLWVEVVENAPAGAYDFVLDKK